MILKLATPVPVAVQEGLKVLQRLVGVDQVISAVIFVIIVDMDRILIHIEAERNLLQSGEGGVECSLVCFEIGKEGGREVLGFSCLQHVVPVVQVGGHQSTSEGGESSLLNEISVFSCATIGQAIIENSVVVV